MSDAKETSLKRKVAGQGVLLFAGFGLAQACSFARNAMLGHLLSKGDFGIAATITLTLQLLETATDIAADRFIIQSDSGNDRQLMGIAHAVQLMRAVVIAALLWLIAPLAAGLFHVPQAAWGFQAASLALLVKGFTHLDSKRLQKQLDNRAAMLLEIVPQAGALLLTWPAVKLWNSYEAIVWLTLLQAGLGVVISHAVARRSWRMAWNKDLARRLLTFSWPIWLSAIPSDGRLPGRPDDHRPLLRGRGAGRLYGRLHDDDGAGLDRVARQLLAGAADAVASQGVASKRAVRHAPGAAVGSDGVDDGLVCRPVPVGGQPDRDDDVRPEV